MKPILTLLIVCLSVLLVAAVAYGGPNMSIPEQSFDFGYVPQHANVSHTFWLHSTGDSLLQIIKVVPG